MNEPARVESPPWRDALPRPSAHQAGKVRQNTPPSQQATMAASPIAASGSFSAK